MWLFNTLRYAKRSPSWPSLRKKHLNKYPCCQCCGSCTKPEVHHIIPVHVDSTKELDADNLITLCDKYCHFVFGHLMDYKSWNPDIVLDSNEYRQKIQNKPKK